VALRTFESGGLPISLRAEVLGRRLLAEHFSFAILSAIEVLWLACSSAQRFVTGDS